MHSPRGRLGQRPRSQHGSRRGLTPLRKLAITTAEPSGDLQAGALAEAILRRHPDWRFLGVGSSKMRQAGVEVFMDSSTWGTIGPAEALPTLAYRLWQYRQLRVRLLKERPDLLIVIDAPAIHYRLAGWARRHGIRCVYYFPPSQWSTNPKRFRKIHERVDTAITAFGFNARQYAAQGLEVGYFGHPLIDIIGTVPTREEAQRLLNLPPGRYVTLMPGSRTLEVRLMLPVLLEVAARLKARFPELHFLVPGATRTLETRIRQMIPAPPPFLRLLSGSSRGAMAASELAVMASGSASLEAALLGVPHVLFYIGARLDWWLFRLLTALGLLRVRRFGLCNLVLDEDVMPEFLQYQASPERLADEAERLLLDGPYRDRMLHNLARVRAALGEPGVVERVARVIERLAEGATRSEALREVHASWIS